MFQRAVQTYLWALPALNMYGMKEGSEKTFGKGYNVLPIFKKRLNAKTLITTPNSDVIYALGYLDLKEDGPMVIEVPPGLQGILDDFWQRPICSEGKIDGKTGAATSGCPAPTRARVASIWCCRRITKARFRKVTFRIVRVPTACSCSGAASSRTESARRTSQSDGADENISARQEGRAKPMQFPNASGVPANMLYPQDGSAFEMLARFIEHEYVDPRDFEMRGIAASLGIVKGKPFAAGAKAKKMLDLRREERHARIGHTIPYSGPRFYTGPAVAQSVPRR